MSVVATCKVGHGGLQPMDHGGLQPQLQRRHDTCGQLQPVIQLTCIGYD